MPNKLNKEGNAFIAHNPKSERTFIMKKIFHKFGVFVYALVIFSVAFAHQCYGIDCTTTMNGNWSNASIWDCGHVPIASNTAYVGTGLTLTLDTDIQGYYLGFRAGSTIDAGSHTLSFDFPFGTMGWDGTFNAGTSTVKLSDADNWLYNDYTYNNLIMNTLTAPRTITIGSPGLPRTITVNGNFISGSSLTNTISFVKGNAASNVANPVTSYYCASNGGIDNITCLPGGPPPTAPTGLTTGTITQNSVVLNWNDNSSNETGFKVYDGDTLLTTTAEGIQTYHVTGLTCNTGHTFKVKATNTDGDSAAAATTPAITTTSACVVPVTAAGITLNSVGNI